MNLRVMCLTASLLAVTIPSIAVDLVKDGRPAAAIVIPDKAFPSVRFAAEELQYHIRKSSGAELPIIKVSEKSSLPGRISLGGCGKGSALDTAAMPRFSFAVKTDGNELILAGRDEDGQVLAPGTLKGSLRDSAGTLLAVYDFLDRDLGVRHLWPGDLGTYVPHKQNIIVDNLDRTGHPAVAMAHFRINPSSDGWSKKQACEDFAKEEALWLIRQRFVTVDNYHYGHKFGSYWKLFGKTNLEFFQQLPDGRRGPLPDDSTGGKRVSMCVSNPELQRQIVAEYRKSYNPKLSPLASVNVLNACENDTPGMCCCPTCRSWDAADPAFSTHPYWSKGVIPNLKQRFPFLNVEECGGTGQGTPSLSDRYARFYLTLQKQAEEFNPQVRVYGFAYANYTSSPKQVKLNDRIIISYVGWPDFPIDAARLQQTRDEWNGWHNTGASLILRPNSTHAGHNMPLFYGRKLGNDLREKLHTSRMLGVNYDCLTGQFATQGPTLYVLSRLIARPDLTADAALNEYYSAFGTAGNAVRAYFDYWEKIADAVSAEQYKRWYHELTRINFKNWLQVADRIFTPQVMSNGRQLLDKAMTAAGNDQEAKARVEFLSKGLTHAELTLKTLAAQRTCQAKETQENVKRFQDAMATLMEFRASVEKDNIADMGYLYLREKSGSGWKHSDSLKK